MEYITVQEAAKKWKISDRLVQKYCAKGRIDGIRKFGKSWGIPSSAVKMCIRDRAMTYWSSASFFASVL